MNDKKNNAPTAEPELPAFVKKAPELLPLWDWWVKEGRSTLMLVVIAGIVAGGFYGWRTWARSRDAAANTALVTAFAADEIEQAVQQYGSTKVGMPLRLRLAKSYYDAARYEDALEVYDELAKSGHPAFVDIAVIGRAFALEGQKKNKEAHDAFAAYAGDASKTNSYLILTAELGAARTSALSGDKDAALAALDALKKKYDGKPIELSRIERQTDTVKRYDPARKERSLFDIADAEAKALNENSAKAPAAKKPAAPATAKPAEPAPAK